jgi:hypothetical protein
VIETLTGALVEAATNDTDRELSVARPSRSVSAVRDASRVPARIARWEACVANRESHRNPKARNPRSSAQGTYQFLDRLWRTSLAGQVAARLRDHGLPRSQSRLVRDYLTGHEIATWPAVYQTIGFLEVNARGGSYHWKLAGSTCEAWR